MMDWAREEVRAGSIGMDSGSIVARGCPGGAGVADQVNCLVRSLDNGSEGLRALIWNVY